MKTFWRRLWYIEATCTIPNTGIQVQLTVPRFGRRVTLRFTMPRYIVQAEKIRRLSP